MVKEKVSALPVTELGRLVGIVTETDVLELFVRGMGAASRRVGSTSGFPMTGPRTPGSRSRAS